jgi:hypothetical protein
MTQPETAFAAFVRQPVILALLSAVTTCSGFLQAGELPPREADFGYLSWDTTPPYFQGKPEDPAAPRILWFETGTYALAIDTRTLALPHAGPVKRTRAETLISAREDAGSFAPGRLALSITLGSETYAATGFRDVGNDFLAYPVRFVETGRWLQHVDLNGVIFRDKDGHELAADAHLEINAWPDRVTFFAEVKPKTNTTEARLALEVAAPGFHAQPAAGKEALSTTVTLLCEGARADAGPPPEVSATAADNSAPIVLYRPDIDAWEVKIEGATWSNPDGTYYPAAHLDRVDRWPVRLRNDSDRDRIVRLIFTRTTFLPITGLCPMWLDSEGQPAGESIQLSKDWHANAARPDLLHQGFWLRASTAVRVEAHSERRLQFALCYAKWGGLFAASHAQLSLIGYSHNQFWDEAALGSFGESICFEPGRVQRRCFITDVRPFLVTHTPEAKRWEWTANVGGGDFLVYFDAAKRYVPFAHTRTDYRSPGPCLTRTTYAETSADGAVAARMEVSLARGQDHLRVYQHLRYDVRRDAGFSRLAFAQVAADYYNGSIVRKLAVGNANGLIEEWPTGQGSWEYGRRNIALSGQHPWVSAHEQMLDGTKGEGGATRGFILRSWRARLGGVDDTPPYLATYHTEDGPKNFRTVLELAPPASLTALKAGDFVQADLEWCVFPLRAEDYYGPDDVFRSALRDTANTWRPVHREAMGNPLRALVAHGTLEASWPPRIRVDRQQRAEVAFPKGLGHLPITFTCLKKPSGYKLSQHTKEGPRVISTGDFWQSDYDETVRTWSLTCNVTPEQAAAGLLFR